VTTTQDLSTLLRSRVPLVVLETTDEARAVDLVLAARPAPRAASPFGQVIYPDGDGAPVFTWKVTEGLRRRDIDLGTSQRTAAAPVDLLRGILEGGLPGIYVLLDLHPYLDDPVTVRLVKDIALAPTRRTLVLVSHAVDLPDELEHLAARYPVAFPDRAERRALVDRVVHEWLTETGRAAQVDARAADLLVENLAGLSLSDAERLARAAVFDDGALLPSDVPAVTRAKHALLAKDGVLSYELDTVPLDQVAGMGRLKQWLSRRAPAFDGSAPHLDPPRGLLMLGVQGCGKSVVAKAAAHVLGVPLLRLDLAATHDKYVGESERRLRDSLSTAEAMAPCVLWIDEIEKAVSAGSDDSGPGRRLLGTLLTWLAEPHATVLVVATANDITALPPELVRKGRFDEIFFVDLPAPAVRAEILRIHAERRGVLLDPALVPDVVLATDGFSGAEIEQAVVSATYAAHDGDRPPGLVDVLAEVRATRPLSAVMAEPVARLRAWASTRTVPAD
jgi:hypothetical protein